MKIGALTGTSLWRLSTSDVARNATVDHLNDGTLDGIVMTDQVGACGHTLIGANIMIFIGSLYSHAQEEQAIGMYSKFAPNLLHRPMVLMFLRRSNMSAWPNKDASCCHHCG